MRRSRCGSRARDAGDTVTHGDYRLDNLMFAGPDGGAPIAAVDWQTPGHGPAITRCQLLPRRRSAAGRAARDRTRAGRASTRRHWPRYGVDIDDDELWQHYRRDAYAGIVMAVVASQIVGTSDRSEAMFAAMATRHAQHVFDLDSESLL